MQAKQVDHSSQIAQIQALGTYHQFSKLDLEQKQLTELYKGIFSYDNIFKTRKARELFTQLINKIKPFTSTNYTKVLLNKFLPTINKEEILKRQQWCEQALQTFSKITNLEETKQQIQLATTIQYNSKKRHNGICIAFSDKELYDKYKDKLNTRFYCTVIDNTQDFISIDHYEQIRFICDQHSNLRLFAERLEQTTIIQSEDLTIIAPELITDIIEQNTEALHALQQLSSILNNSQTFTTKTTSSKKFSEIDAEINKVANNFQEYLSQIISQAKFSGEDMMQVMQQKKSLLQLLPEQIQQEIEHKKRELFKPLQQQLNGQVGELITVDTNAQVHIDEQLLKKEELTHQANIAQNKYKNLVELAIENKQFIESLPKVIESVYELDLQLSISQFIKEYELTKPSIVEKGVTFVYGKNLNIKDAHPIEYYIGNEQQVAVVTGANSGGKTTLLELVAHIQLLTQMGLFVPAKEAKVGIIEELYYFSKNKGSLNAGAFETLLKQFAGITDSNAPKLILADEIEAVTEPDIAATMIKGIINHIKTQPQNILILVTHMGKELQEKALEARFDGIEAKGLDKDHNLVVDRNPVIGKIARSTPQLIVERLAKTEKTKFFEDLYQLVK